MMRVSAQGVAQVPIVLPNQIPSDYGAAVDAAGNVWLPYNDIVHAHYGVIKVAPDGTMSGPYPTGVTPTAAAVDAHGDIWVSGGQGTKIVTKHAPDGRRLGVFTGGGGVAAGPGGSVWIFSYSEVVRLTP